MPPSPPRAPDGIGEGSTGMEILPKFDVIPMNYSRLFICFLNNSGAAVRPKDAHPLIKDSVFNKRMAKGILFLSIVFLSFCLPFTANAAGDDHAEAGVAAFRSGNFQQAASELETALEAGVKEYNDWELYTILGNSYVELERYEDAIDAHKQSLIINPDYYIAWVNLGIVYRLIGRYDDTEECYKRALELSPDYPELHASLGALYIYRQQPEQAIASLKHAIELDPHLPVSHSNLALAYAMVGRFEEAEASLKTAVLLGYENAPVIQKRINDLKALEIKE